MRVYYLIRLDDASPYMESDNWKRVENILDKYGVKPLVGIIPANADPATQIDSEDKCFWDNVHRWIIKGWEIALHGYDHVCISNDGLKGLNPIWERSEFAGVPFELQKDKICKGLAVMKEQGIFPDYFFAPSHTFDKNTLKVIRECTPMHYISDMIATRPFRYHGLSVIPCQMGVFREVPIPGYWCACYHPNNMNDKDFKELEYFLRCHNNDFLSFHELPKAGKRGVINKMISFIYFFYRKIR